MKTRTKITRASAARIIPNTKFCFCVDQDDPALPMLEKLIREFPERQIRLLFGSGRNAINDKVGRLYRLTNEAKYDLFVITDGDVRVGADYLRTIVSPFRDPNVGAATCLYVSTKETNLMQELQSIGMISDFFARIMVAWKLDDLKFTFGQTIVTTRKSGRAMAAIKCSKIARRTTSMRGGWWPNRDSK